MRSNSLMYVAILRYAVAIAIAVGVSLTLVYRGEDYPASHVTLVLALSATVQSLAGITTGVLVFRAVRRWFRSWIARLVSCCISGFLGGVVGVIATIVVVGPLWSIVPGAHVDNIFIVRLAVDGMAISPAMSAIFGTGLGQPMHVWATSPSLGEEI